jgi:signal transduction histidine kinase
VRLPVLLDRVVELHAHELETRGAVVVREYARDVPPIQADEEALYQALVNVVSNAVEAMGPGGRLTLRLGWHDGTELRAGRARLFNRRVRIEVSDTGTGIAPSDAERVFNPFFTTRDGGTGLGLALTHKIVDDHSGTIDFQSRPGAGTTFRITLPVAAEPAAEREIDGGTR